MQVLLRGNFFTFGNFLEVPPIVIGRERKFWFLDSLKRLFSHFYYVFLHFYFCIFIIIFAIQNKKLCTTVFFPFFEWLSYNASQGYSHLHGYMIHLWCIFLSKNKPLLTWSFVITFLWFFKLSWENQVVLYFVLHWKVPRTFLSWSISLASQSSLFIAW